MARRRVPVVGAKGLHVAQLTPEVRAILAHRASAAARREYAPTIKADRASLGIANSEYGAEKRSARGATNAIEAALSQALAGLGKSGLSGRYRRQVANEFTSRAADTAQALPSLMAGIEEERRKALREGKVELLQDRAAMQKGRAEMFNQLLKEGREQASSLLASKEKAATPTKSEKNSIQNAAISLKGFLSNWQQNPKVKNPQTGQEEPLKKQLPLNGIDEWRHVAEEMVKHGEGFDLTDAMKVIRHYLRKVVEPKRAEQILSPF